MNIPPPIPHQSVVDHVYRHSRYLVRRKVFKLFGAAFHIYDPEGNVAFFSNLKAFKLKEDIRLYTGEDMQTELLSIHARQVMDISASYDVFDSITGVKVGALRRKGMKSILRDEWLILDVNDREIGLIQEDHMALALLRRLLTNLVPQQYHGMINGQTVCKFKQNFNPFVLKVQLDYAMDNNGKLDRRLGIAAAVLLCAIEGRQN
jgi:uncharacterized protein YxjI